MPGEMVERGDGMQGTRFSHSVLAEDPSGVKPRERRARGSFRPCQLSAVPTRTMETISVEAEEAAVAPMLHMLRTLAESSRTDHMMEILSYVLSFGNPWGEGHNEARRAADGGNGAGGTMPSPVQRASFGGGSVPPPEPPQGATATIAKTPFFSVANAFERTDRAIDVFFCEMQWEKVTVPPALCGLV